MGTQKIKILALIGKSASGKDTIQNSLVTAHPDVTHKIISCTTRPPRESEQEGIDYYFLTPEQFLQKIDKQNMLEYTKFRGWYYGTAIEQLDKDKINVGVFNPAGARVLLSNSRLDVRVIYIQAKDKTRLKRSLNREENPDCKEICRRFFTDEKDFEDLSGIPYKIWDNDSYDDYRSDCNTSLAFAHEFWIKHYLQSWVDENR